MCVGVRGAKANDELIVSRRGAALGPTHKTHSNQQQPNTLFKPIMQKSKANVEAFTVLFMLI